MGIHLTKGINHRHLNAKRKFVNRQSKADRLLNCNKNVMSDVKNSIKQANLRTKAKVQKMFWAINTTPKNIAPIPTWFVQHLAILLGYFAHYPLSIPFMIMKTRFAALLAFLWCFAALPAFAGSGGTKDKNGVECNIEIAFDYAVDQLSVEFSNISLGNYDLLLWDFGDHNSSREAKPKHTYAQEGKYDFCLTAINTERQCENRFCGEVYVFK